MLDHLSLSVPASSFDAVVDFYLAALAPIKYEKLMEFPGVVGLGPKDKAESAGGAHGAPDFWLTAMKDEEGKGKASGGVHVAFGAKDHETVDKFHQAAVKAGGVCNGEPGLRAMYSPKYYAAFVRDPMGNNIEVVDHPCHE